MPLQVFNKIRNKDVKKCEICLIEKRKKEITSLIEWNEKIYEMNEFLWRSIWSFGHLKLLLNLNSIEYKMKDCMEYFPQTILFLKSVN